MNSKITNFVCKTFFGVGIALLTGSATQAQAMPHISIFGLGNYTFYNQDVLTTQVRGTFGYGGGLMGDFMLSPGISFELAAAYNVQRIKITDTVAGSTTQQSKTVHIPAGLNFHLAGMSRLFLGGYYDYALTDGNSNDYGAAIGLRFRMGAVFFEPRFIYGLKKDGNDKNNLEGQFLLGYTFGAGR